MTDTYNKMIEAGAKALRELRIERLRQIVNEDTSVSEAGGDLSEDAKACLDAALAVVEGDEAAVKIDAAEKRTDGDLLRHQPWLDGTLRDRADR